MIVPGQKNLKVHFAGAEQLAIIASTYIGGVKYVLFSVFPFICKQFDIEPYPIFGNASLVPKYLEERSRHVIMDSGLFTLMFGAQAGKRDKKFMDRWYDALVLWVLQNNYQGTCVEIDAQKVLGIKAAWDYRQRMAKDLPNRQINVFHIEDGPKGLDRLIEFSDYIALSIPELRILGKKNHAIRLVHYIKNRKPTIDVHLLGCTEQKLLEPLKFCTSSDSTSYQQINRYGSIKGLAVRDIKVRKLVKRYRMDTARAITDMGLTVTDKNILYYMRYALAAEYQKEQYTKWCGDQN